MSEAPRHIVSIWLMAIRPRTLFAAVSPVLLGTALAMVFGLGNLAAASLALIGAIVAEFFGTPIVGMGFRISTGVGSLNVDMVWAEIAVAALAGSLFYALLAGTERLATFWHPSYRAQT